MSSQHISQILSNKMANMSFVCAVLVVSLHVGFVPTGGGGGIVFIRNAIAPIAVPWFFLAAGFFLAGHIEGRVCDWGPREVAKRVRSLLVPLAFWLVFMTFYGSLARVGANYVARRPLGEEVLLLQLLNGEVDLDFGIYWFLRMLFILVCLSPLLRRPNKGLLFLLLVVYWTVECVPELTSSSGPCSWSIYKFSLRGLFYFAVGIYLRQRMMDCRFIERHKVAICFGCGIAGVLLWCMSEGRLAFDSVSSFKPVIVPFVLLAVWSILPSQAFPKACTSASFAIYMMQFVALIPLSIVAKRVPFPDDFARFLFVWIGGASLCIVLAKVVRTCPRLASVMLGGR